MFFLFLALAAIFYQQSGTIFAILVKGHKRNSSVKIILKSGHWPRRRCPLKVFLFLVLVAKLLAALPQKHQAAHLFL